MNSNVKVQDLMSRDPETCTPKDTCAMALEIMKRKNCGCVPVVDSPKIKRVVGMVTDRDIALQLFQSNRPADKVLVETCMSRPPKTIFPQATLEEAVQLMEAAAVHRLPVVEEDILVGILSLKDIASFAAHGQGPLAKEKEEAEPAERQIAELIEAIAVSR